MGNKLWTLNEYSCPNILSNTIKLDVHFVHVHGDLVDQPLMLNFPQMKSADQITGYRKIHSAR